MEQLSASLLLWVALNTGYAVDDIKAPRVVLLSAAELHALPAHLHVASERVDGYSGHRSGAFDWGKDGAPTIYLVRPSEVPQAENFADARDNPMFRVALVHQLVHFAQWVTGASRTFRCATQGEAAAEAIGWNYLNSLGVSTSMPSIKRWASLQLDC
jgi:hypothetical protein